MKIAFLQLLPGSDAFAACREAKAKGADLALFPEMWSSGYSVEATPAGEAFLQPHAALAAELEMAIAVTLLEAFSPSPRNTVVLFDRHGQEVLRYAKVHTCDFGEERVLTPGEDFFVATLDTAEGPVEVGAMICYDREFPESARILMLKGAELILVPNACPMELNRLSQLRGRAYENMVAVATCNYPAPHPDCNGHSSLFDGVAYWEGIPGSRDTCLLEAGEEPGIYLAELDLSMLRTYRREEVHGNAFRRPEKYGLLLDGTVREPFIRKEKR